MMNFEEMTVLNQDELMNVKGGHWTYIGNGKYVTEDGDIVEDSGIV